MILICAKLVNQVESCPRKHHIHTRSVLMCFLEIANNSTFVHPGKCEGSLFVWPQQRERQWLQKSFLMTRGLWAPKLTNTTELWDFTSTLTAGMCVRVSHSLYIYECILLYPGVTFTVEHERALRGLSWNTEVRSEALGVCVLCCWWDVLGAAAAPTDDINRRD